MRLRIFIAISLLALGLAGCGGSSGGSGATASSSPVQGLSTPTRVSIVNAK